MNRPYAIAAVLLAACSGEAATPPPPVRPEPVAPHPPAEPEAHPPEPAPPPAPLFDVVPPDQTYSVLTLPAQVRVPRLRVRAREYHFEGDEYMWGEAQVSWEEALHPDPGARAAIATWASDRANGLLSQYTTSPSCSLALAHERAVVSVCQSASAAPRSGGQPAEDVFAARVDGDHLVDFDIGDALVMRPSLRDLVRQRCQEERARLVDEQADRESQLVQCDQSLDVYFPANEGLGVDFTQGNEIFGVVIPWRQLRDSVRADGPLAPVFASEGVHDVTVPGSEQLQGQLALSCWLTLAVSPPLPVDDALHAAMRAHDAMTELTFLFSDGAGTHGRLALSPCARSVAEAQAAGARATHAATLLGSAVERLPGYSGNDSVRWLRVQSPLALRAGATRTDAFQLTLPAGSIVASILGYVGPQSSRISYQGTWARIFPSRATSGWSAGRYLGLSRRAPIDPMTMLGALPANVRDAAAEGAIVGDLAPVAAEAPRWFVLAQVASEPAVYAVIGDGAHPARAPGTLDEMVWAELSESELYPLVGTRIAGAAPGLVRWQLFAPGAREPGWTLDAPTSAVLPDAERATLATNVVHDHLRWIAEVRMPDRSVVRVRWHEGSFVEERAAR